MISPAQQFLKARVRVLYVLILILLWTLVPVQNAAAQNPWYAVPPPKDSLQLPGNPVMWSDDYMSCFGTTGGWTNMLFSLWSTHDRGMTWSHYPLDFGGQGSEYYTELLGDFVQTGVNDFLLFGSFAQFHRTPVTFEGLGSWRATISSSGTRGIEESHDSDYRFVGQDHDSDIFVQNMPYPVQRGGRLLRFSNNFDAAPRVLQNGLDAIGMRTDNYREAEFKNERLGLVLVDSTGQDSILGPLTTIHLERTVDSGKTWAIVEQSPPDSHHRTDLRQFHFLSGSRWIGIGTNGIMESNDDGATWKLLNNSPPYPLELMFVDSIKGYLLVDSSSDMYATTDGGRSWKIVAHNAGDRYRKLFRVSDSLVFIIGSTVRWCNVSKFTPCPGLLVHDHSLNFGYLKIGDSSTLVLTISNSGELPLEIYGFSTSSNDFHFLHSPKITLQPGELQTLIITFTPTKGEYLHDSLIIHCNAMSIDSIIFVDASAYLPSAVSGMIDGAKFPVRIFPNPAQASETVVLPFASSHMLSYSVTDVLGREELKGSVPADARQFAIDVGSLSRGAFTVRINGESSILSTRFVK